jgi:hypothetical protein
MREQPTVKVCMGPLRCSGRFTALHSTFRVAWRTMRKCTRSTRLCGRSVSVRSLRELTRLGHRSMWSSLAAFAWCVLSLMQCSLVPMCRSGIPRSGHWQGTTIGQDGAGEAQTLGALYAGGRRGGRQNVCLPSLTPSAADIVQNLPRA